MKKFFIIFSLGIAACSNSGQNVNSMESNIEPLDVAAFKSHLADSKEEVLLDVRTPAEFAGGSIEGAINIDFKAADFEQKIGELDKTKTYFVYCLSGIRSKKAADRMSELGFESLYVLNGGYSAWTEKQSE
jgi:rhodanese-related sulfurtransferase